MIVAFHGVGQQLNDVIHQHQAAQAGNAGAAQHGEQAQVGHAAVQAGHHFAVGKVVAFKEAIHQRLIGFGNGFLQGIVEFLNNGNLVLRNLNFHPLQVLHLIGALIEYVYDAGNLLGGVPDGDDDRGNLIAVALPQRVEGGVVIGIILVYLGDVDKAGHIALLAVFPCLFKANGDAVFGGQNQNGCIGSAEGFHNGTGEVETTGGIQQVNLGVVIFQRNHRGGNGNMTANFFGVVIANGVAVGVLADPVNDTGHVK